MMILCKVADKTQACVRLAAQKGWIVELRGLSEEASIEYMSKYINVPASMLPRPLSQYIFKVSLGNPLYIRETINQLKTDGHLKIETNHNGHPENVNYPQDLESINIAAWVQTAMVGETVCLLESLDPLEAAVLKMSTVFSGAFTLPDLASSSCSHWSGATHFDYLRLYRAMQDLLNRKIIEQVKERKLSDDSPKKDGAGSPGENNLQMFEMRNVLIRKVGSSMLLEAQKKVIKRQALMDRVLSRDLPSRMEIVYAKRLEPHIPWYYENVLAK